MNFLEFPFDKHHPPLRYYYIENDWALFRNYYFRLWNSSTVCKRCIRVQIFTAMQQNIWWILSELLITISCVKFSKKLFLLIIWYFSILQMPMKATFKLLIRYFLCQDVRRKFILLCVQLWENRKLKEQRNNMTFMVEILGLISMTVVKDI